MKRTTTTFALALLISLFASSQSYHPFPESNTFWRYTYSGVPNDCPCMGTCHYSQYLISGDTLIGSLTYYKLTESRITLLEGCAEVYDNYGYQGAFRNDIETKNVWFVPEGENTEALLYEFDLQIGDTLSQGILNPNGDDYFVMDIDSVEIGGNYRKRFLIKFEYNYWGEPFKIIEGIGGQNLIRPLENWNNFETGYWFNCINIADTLIYPGSCEMIVGTNPIIKEQSFEIFPNPTSGQLWIKNPNSKEDFISVEIFNSFGKKLMEFETSEEITQIDLSEKPKGVYLIRIKSGSKVFSEKIIVQ